jgi:catechol 2,3-dioxygenase-like lactoylglutathione lyase family enzyme
MVQYLNEESPVIDGLDHLVLTVSDLDRSESFYRDVLGMRATSFAGGKRSLHAGSIKINLHLVSAPLQPHAAIIQPGSADFCLYSAQPWQHWQRHLARYGIKIEVGPVERSGACGPIESIYVRDPDENLVEIARRKSSVNEGGNLHS